MQLLALHSIMEPGHITPPSNQTSSVQQYPNSCISVSTEAAKECLKTSPGQGYTAWPATLHDSSLHMSNAASWYTYFSSASPLTLFSRLYHTTVLYKTFHKSLTECTFKIWLQQKFQANLWNVKGIYDWIFTMNSKNELRNKYYSIQYILGSHAENQWMVHTWTYCKANEKWPLPLGSTYLATWVVRLVDWW